MWISQTAKEAGVNAQAMRDTLTHLVDSCHHGGAAECPIIFALNEVK